MTPTGDTAAKTPSGDMTTDVEQLEALRTECKAKGFWGPKWEVIRELGLENAAYYCVAKRAGSADLQQHLHYVVDADLVLRWEEVELLRALNDKLRDLYNSWFELQKTGGASALRHRS